jgi:hypothetical protein
MAFGDSSDGIRFLTDNQLTRVYRRPRERLPESWKEWYRLGNTDSFVHLTAENVRPFSIPLSNSFRRVFEECRRRLRQTS